MTQITVARSAVETMERTIIETKRRAEAAEAEAARLQTLLDGRDKFIVDAGLWERFVATLARPAEAP